MNDEKKLLARFPFIVQSRGWDAEDMEQNIVDVAQSQELRDGAKELVKHSVEMAGVLLGHVHAEEKTARGGRKAHRLEVFH